MTSGDRDRSTNPSHDAQLFYGEGSERENLPRLDADGISVEGEDSGDFPRSASPSCFQFLSPAKADFCSVRDYDDSGDEEMSTQSQFGGKAGRVSPRYGRRRRDEIEFRGTLLHPPSDCVEMYSSAGEVIPGGGSLRASPLPEVNTIAPSIEVDCSPGRGAEGESLARGGASASSLKSLQAPSTDEESDKLSIGRESLRSLTLLPSSERLLPDSISLSSWTKPIRYEESRSSIRYEESRSTIKREECRSSIDSPPSSPDDVARSRVSVRPSSVSPRSVARHDTSTRSVVQRGRSDTSDESLRKRGEASRMGGSCELRGGSREASRGVSPQGSIASWKPMQEVEIICRLIYMMSLP